MLLLVDILCTGLTGVYCVLKGKLITKSDIDGRSIVQFPLFRLLCAPEVGVHACVELWGLISVVEPPLTTELH